MSTLKEILDSVQACDNRNFIQILNQEVTEAIIEAKAQACERVTEVLTNYGIEDIQPCEIITEDFLERITQGQPIIALENLLNGQGFPPHLIRFIAKGADALTLDEYQEVLLWTVPLTGIQVQQNTSRYIRDINSDQNTPRLLDLAQTREVEEFYEKQGIQGITQYYQNKLREYITDKIKCPTAPVVEQLLNVVRNLTNFLNRARQILVKIEEIARVVSGIVSIVSNTIPILKKIILGLDTVGIPTLAAIPVIGGLAAILANVNRIISGFLIKYQTQIKNLSDALCATSSVISFANAGITLAYAFVTMIEELLKGCITKELAQDLQTLSQFAPLSFSRQDSIQYRGYRLEVRTVSDNTPVPSRYAVAIDSVGVVVLEGPKSFSSSTKVLIDELKFRIDNQLG